MRRQVLLIVWLASLGAAVALADEAPYQVAEGNKTDQKTFEGWRTWRALACERCHGAQQEGGVGPALVESLKTMTKDQFKLTVMEGRIDKGMPPWKGSDMMQQNWEGLYAYLKGRSDGKIAPGHVYPMDGKPSS
jgi:mono/diheme cytochrome c family protein